MTVDAKTLADRIESSGILSRAEMDRALDGLRDDALETQASEVAEQLVRETQLTQFQADSFMSASPSPLVYGDYILQEQIGRGGMGVVYKARHRHLQRIVALKLVSPMLVDAPRAVERFQREIQAAGKLVHPNIVTAYDASEAHGQLYLVMEYVAGRNLNEYLKESGPVSEKDAIGLIIQAARGLAFAHSQGIVHRDVKPSNMLVDESGVLKLLDLGLAHLERDALTGDTSITQSSGFLGTAPYVSPEQAVSPRDAGARSDIYSLGCTLYQLITRRLPFEGDSSVAILLAKRDHPPPHLKDACPDVSTELDELCYRMMAIEPTDRPSTMEEVIDGLEGCLSALDQDNNSADDAPRSFESSERHPYGEQVSRRNRNLTYLVVTLLALFSSAIAVVYFAIRETDTDPRPALAERERETSDRAPVTNGRNSKADDDPQTSTTSLPPVEPKQRLRLATFTPPSNKVHAVALSSQGVLALADWDGYIRLLDAKTMSPTNHVLAHPGGAMALDFSDDGRWLASGGKDKLAHIWDVSTLTKVKTFRGHEHVLLNLDLSSDKKTLVTGSVDKTGRLWDVETQSERSRFEDANDWIRWVRFYPEEDAVIWASDKSVKIWDIKSKRVINELKGHTQPCWQFAFDPASRTVVTIGFDRTMRLFDLNQGGSERLIENAHATAPFSVAVSADGRLLATGAEREIHIWNTKDGSRLARLMGHGNTVWGLVFSEDGKRLYSCSDDYTAMSWDVDLAIASGGNPQTLPIRYVSAMKGPRMYGQMALAKDGNRLFVPGATEGVEVFDLNTNKKMGALPHKGAVAGVAVTTDGKTIASAGFQDRHVRLWNADTLAPNTSYHAAAGVTGVAYAPKGDLLAAGLENGKVIVWDVKGGDRKWTIQADNDRVWTVAFSPDGSEMAIGTRSGAIKLFDVETGKLTKSLMGHASRVWNVTYSRDGAYLASATEGGLVGLWDTESDSPVALLDGHCGKRVRQVTFSHDGRLLLSAGFDQTALVWDVATRKVVATLAKHTGQIESVVISDDGRRVIIGSADRTLSVWERESPGASD